MGVLDSPYYWPNGNAAPFSGTGVVILGCIAVAGLFALIQQRCSEIITEKKQRVIQAWQDTEYFAKGKDGVFSQQEYHALAKELGIKPPTQPVLTLITSKGSILSDDMGVGYFYTSGQQTSFGLVKLETLEKYVEKHQNKQDNYQQNTHNSDQNQHSNSNLEQRMNQQPNPVNPLIVHKAPEALIHWRKAEKIAKGDDNQWQYGELKAFAEEFNLPTPSRLVTWVQAIGHTDTNNNQRVERDYLDIKYVDRYGNKQLVGQIQLDALIKYTSTDSTNVEWTTIDLN